MNRIYPSFDELKRKIHNYDDVLKELKIGRRINIPSFDEGQSNSYSQVKDVKIKTKMDAFIAIKNIEKLFCGDWMIDWTNHRQYKYYPYFERTAAGWRFYGSVSHFSSSSGGVAFYPNSEISDFVGRLFMQYYIILAE